MLKVIGSVTVEFESDGEKVEQTIDGAEFSLQEDGWRNLGDGDRQYEALFIYFGDHFEIHFQATYFQGRTTCYECTAEGDVRIIDDNIDAQYAGSGNEEDDFDEYQ